MAREVIEVPMPGKILAIKVKVGDAVKEDDEIIILEAMKMENPIVAPVAGKIVEIRVNLNQAVETGQAIAVIEY
jgi:biotin carboxyl carrier protein